MSYIGYKPVQGNVVVDEFTSNGVDSTYTLSSQPTNNNTVEVVVGGLTQTSSAYSFSGNVLTLVGVASGTKIIVRQHGEKLLIPTPGDNTVTNAKMADNAIDSAEIVAGAVDVTHMSANSVDSSQLVAGSVDLAHLSATGTASSSTFLKGNNSWAEVDALPTQTSHSGKYLTTNGSAASWDTLDTDANKTTKGLYEHSNVISVDYVIGNNNNALTAGPITINSSISVTIPSGSTWVIA